MTKSANPSQQTYRESGLVQSPGRDMPRITFASIALEIVGADRAAQIRPSAGAPIIHIATPAGELLEALCLAQWRRFGPHQAFKFPGLNT